MGQCDFCERAAIAVKVGQEAERALDLFNVTRARRDVRYCVVCWVKRFGRENTASP